MQTHRLQTTRTILHNWDIWFSFQTIELGRVQFTFHRTKLAPSSGMSWAVMSTPCPTGWKSKCFCVQTSARPGLRNVHANVLIDFLNLFHVVIRTSTITTAKTVTNIAHRPLKKLPSCHDTEVLCRDNLAVSFYHRQDIYYIGCVLENGARPG